MSRLMLAAFSSGVFLATSAGIAIAPFLLAMAQDFQADLALVGTLVAVSSVSWGIVSLAAGPASDRLGVGRCSWPACWCWAARESCSRWRPRTRWRFGPS